MGDYPVAQGGDPLSAICQHLQTALLCPPNSGAYMPQTTFFSRLRFVPWPVQYSSHNAKHWFVHVVALTADPNLADELITQLLKQLTHNLGQRSSHAGWKVLCAACALLSPWRSLKACLMAFLKSNALDSVFGNAASFCIVALAWPRPL
jgi:hypothetical protein